MINQGEKRHKKDPLIVDGQHEAIISVEVWNRAQELIQQKATTPSRKFTGKFILAGWLKCPQCGAAMVGTNHNRTLATGEKKQYRQYVCGNFHHKGSSVCSSNMIKADEIEKQISERLGCTGTPDRSDR